MRDKILPDDVKCDVEAGYNRSEQSKLRLLFGIWRPFWYKKEPSDPGPEEKVMSITRKLEECPKGYSMAANFHSSDSNFLQFRGFLDLHSRLLLDLQFDIVCLERDLDDLDEWDAASGNPQRQKCLHSKYLDRKEGKIERMPQEFQDRFKRTRPQVFAELKAKLKDYDDVLFMTRDVNNLQRLSNRDYRSVQNWFDANKPLVGPEWEYIRRREDLVTLRSGRECAVFDGFVEGCLTSLDKFLESWLQCRIIKFVFMTPELRRKTSDKRVHYYSPARVDVLVNLVITVIIFALLIIPVVVLYGLSNLGQAASPFEAIGILVIFTLLFGGAMSSLTTATRQELFAASAAYCAVLVVFIGNFRTQTVVLAE